MHQPVKPKVRTDGKVANRHMERPEAELFCVSGEESINAFNSKLTKKHKKCQSNKFNIRGGQV